MVHIYYLYLNKVLHIYLFIENIIILLILGNLGEVLIRCNNVLYIKGIDDEDEEGEMKD